VEEIVREAIKRGCNVLSVREWRTPATDYPEQSFGTAEIKKVRQPIGLYLMEGVAGYDLWYNEKPITVTTLKVKGKTWMVDDPINWKGMEILGKAARGKVLTGGLGLGLILHSLAKNPNVTSIDVVENNEDVIKLMKDKLPDKKVRIIKGDMMNKDILGKEYDTIILDLWTGKGTLPIFAEMMGAFTTFKYWYPNANIYIWGMTDPAFNPAVTKKLCDFAMEIKKARLREVI